MPVVRIATFSTCASTGTTDPSSTSGTNNSRCGSFMILRSSIPNREDNPTTNHHNVQEDADGENALHAPSAQRWRAPLHHPDLIDQRNDRDDEKEGLQSLEQKQAASAQKGEDSKSKLDLRKDSSTWCE